MLFIVPWLADIEVLEANYPVQLIRTEIRNGSGGQGCWSGGNGLIREYKFLEPVSLSLLTQRRETAPYGMAGGSEGSPGQNTLIRDTCSTTLAPLCRQDILPGDRLRIETPGGGGYGSPNQAG